MSAQVTVTREETNMIPWAFAVAIGSGIYGLGEENTIYVIRAQPRISLYFSEETTPGERRLKLE